MTIQERIEELHIVDLAAGGDGIGYIDSKVCFVPGAANDDKLRVCVVSENKKMLRARIEEVVAPGPGRREPLCPLVGQCGGCQWQHLTDQTQQAAKKKILAHALKLDDVQLVPSSNSFGYRRLARLHFDPDGEVLGFTRTADHTIINVDRCPILEPPLNGLLTSIKELLSSSNCPKTQVRIASGNDGAVLAFDSDSLLPADLYRNAEKMVPDIFVGAVASIAGQTSLIAGRESVVLDGLDSKPLELPASSFGQANSSVNEKMGQKVLQWTSRLNPKRGIELFAGAGNFTVVIAPFVKKLTAIELDERACVVARKNLEQRGLSRVSVRRGDAVTEYEAAGKRAELVLLDPPRIGNWALAKAIAGGRNRSVIYVSCNPSTLGRDLEVLYAGGFVLKEAVGFDMFPQTAHIEAAVLLERK